MGSLALRPALLLFGNSRPRVATTPLPHATGAYGQLPGRDFNPLDLLLLLRTARLAIKKLASTRPDFLQKLGVLVQQLEQIHDRWQGPCFSALVA